jgi:HPt (histidine-containing phosphotransfer) domain-containing protein
MKNDWNTRYIDPKNLNKVSRGNSKIIVKYLKQFEEIMPVKIDALQSALAAEDREETRKVLHSISPQLQFFGVPRIVPVIRKILDNHQKLPWNTIASQSQAIIQVIEAATAEVRQVLAKEGR